MGERISVPALLIPAAAFDALVTGLVARAEHHDPQVRSQAFDHRETYTDHFLRRSS